MNLKQSEDLQDKDLKLITIIEWIPNKPVQLNNTKHVTVMTWNKHVVIGQS